MFFIGTEEESMDASPEYQKACAEHSKALKAYGAAARAYRERKICDAEFLAARAVKVDADKAFDVAYAEEEEREAKAALRKSVMGEAPAEDPQLPLAIQRMFEIEDFDREPKAWQR